MSEEDIKIDFKAESYETEDGKWIPSGVVIYSNDTSVNEYNDSFKNSPKKTKLEADNYFILTEKRKLKTTD